MPCNRLGTRPLDYIKEGRVPSRAPEQPNTKHRAPYLIPQTGRRALHLGDPNLYKSCVPCPCADLRVHSLPITILTAQSTTSGTPLVGLPVQNTDNHFPHNPTTLDVGFYSPEAWTSLKSPVSLPYSSSSKFVQELPPTLLGPDPPISQPTTAWVAPCGSVQVSPLTIIV
jgi:hypothetical protein